MSVSSIWKRANPISKTLFVLIVLYLVASIYILLFALGVVGNILTSSSDTMWIAYAILSFGVATIIGTYHLSTLIFRRKRITDKAYDTRDPASD